MSMTTRPPPKSAMCLSSGPRMLPAVTWREEAQNTSMTDTLAKAAKEADSFRLTITPEGTRSATAEWKRGFYYIAYKAEIPILLYGADYKKKMIVCTRTFTPTGDYDKDIKEIKNYYKDFKGKKPENFIC